MDYLSSLTALLISLAKRWYFLLIALLINPFALVDELFGWNWQISDEFRRVIFWTSLLVAVWFSYHEVWSDLLPNRLAVLLRLKRDGGFLVRTLDLTLQMADETELQGEEPFVQDMLKGPIGAWLHDVREQLTASELSTFDLDRGGVNDIDISLIIQAKTLRTYINERTNRLDDICEAIKVG